MPYPVAACRNKNSAAAAVANPIEKIAAAGPFATGIEFNAAGTKTLTFQRGDQVAGNFYTHFDTDQGSILFWITPTWNGNDNQAHYAMQWSTHGWLCKTSGNRLELSVASGVTLSVDISGWTAGTTYHIVARWDCRNPLDASSNYLSLSVDDTHTSGHNSAFAPDAPDTTIYIGTNSLGAHSLGGILQGLTILRRPLYDGAGGVNIGLGDEIALSKAGRDIANLVGAYDICMCIPTNLIVETLTTTDKNAWSHIHGSNALIDGFAETTYASSGWSTVGTPSDGPTDITSTERLFQRGYSWIADAVGEGIEQTLSSLLPNKTSYVLRFTIHEASGAIAQLVVIDATNSATLKTFTSPGSSTRRAPWSGFITFELPTVARHGVAADCTSITIQILNSAASGTVFMHQLELYPLIIENPSVDIGAGDPWIPSGWANTTAIVAGDSTGDAIDIHSGDAALKCKAGVVFHMFPGVKAGNAATYPLHTFFVMGHYGHTDVATDIFGAASTTHQTGTARWQNSTNPNDKQVKPIGTVYTRGHCVFRITSNNIDIVPIIIPFAGFAPYNTYTHWYDDFFTYVLDAVELTVT